MEERNVFLQEDRKERNSCLQAAPCRNRMQKNKPYEQGGGRYTMAFPSYDLKPVPVTDAMAAATGARPREAYLARDLLLVYDDEQVVRAMTPDQAKLKARDGRTRWRCCAVLRNDTASLNKNRLVCTFSTQTRRFVIAPFFSQLVFVLQDIHQLFSNHRKIHMHRCIHVFHPKRLVTMCCNIAKTCNCFPRNVRIRCAGFHRHILDELSNIDCRHANGTLLHFILQIQR